MTPDEKIEVTMQVHGLRYEGMTRDVDLLQKLLRDCTKMQTKTLERLKKARRQRDLARRETRKVRLQLKLWKMTNR